MKKIKSMKTVMLQGRAKRREEEVSIDLNFWKYESGTYLDNAVVYQKACCGHEKIDGLEVLPIEDILKETAVAFRDWNSSDLFNYKNKGECRKIIKLAD